MTSVTFEAATIADVLMKAGRVTPKKNDPAFSQAPGIYIHVLEDSIVVRVTDTTVFYTQWSGFISKNGDNVDWHLSSAVVDYCTKLPTGRGKTVTFDDDKHGFLTLTQGRTRATTPLIKAGYPSWDAFDEESSTTVTGLGPQLESVMWACARSNGAAIPVPALTGVYLDGINVAASDGHSAAIVPLEVSSIVDSPVTIPATEVAPLVRHSGEVKLCRVKMGLGISPDEYSQIIVRAYADNKIARMKTPRNYEYEVHVNTEQITSAVGRMTAILKKVENPLVKMFIANEEIILSMRGNDPHESVEDAVEIAGEGIGYPPVLLSFNPEILLRAMEKSPGHTVKMSYNTAGTNVYLSSPGYEAWFAMKTGKRND